MSNLEEQTERYQNDAHFHVLVKQFRMLMEAGQFSISECKDALNLAAYITEAERIRPLAGLPVMTEKEIFDHNSKCKTVTTPCEECAEKDKQIKELDRDNKDLYQTLARAVVSQGKKKAVIDAAIRMRNDHPAGLTDRKPECISAFDAALAEHDKEPA